MSQIAVVTDSSATVPKDIVQQLGIRVVPLVLTFDGHTFRDGIDVTAGTVYRWLRSTKHLPTTASPSIGDFLRVYAGVARDASGIVSIHLSPTLSATYETAVAASRLMDGPPIHIVDCHTAAMGQGFVVIEAARAAAQGADLGEVVHRACDVASRVKLYATIGTLEYLHRGGRIGGAATLLGTLLQIKPVLYLADGHVDVFAKPRTKRQAVRRMLEQMAEAADGNVIHAAILHADVLEEAKALKHEVVKQFNCAELYMTELTPVMGAHTGPEVLGVVFYADEDRGHGKG